MKAETLRQILDKVPDDYEIRYQDKRLGNSFEIDVDNKVLILK